MTTNQTIDGVPRALLERILHCCMFSLSRQQYEELRALLDADKVNNRQMGLVQFVEAHPIKPAVQPQGEPVAQKYDDTLLPFVALMRRELHANAGKGDRPGWLAMSSDTCLLEIIYHFGKLQKAVKRGDGDGMAEYAADVANMCMMLLDICGALAFVEQPAPVAVVLPERKQHVHQGLSHTDAKADGWNACLDEVTRLNTK